MNRFRRITFFATFVFLVGATEPAMAAVSRRPTPAAKKNAKNNQALLTKAWSLKKQDLSKKLAFTERILKNLENGRYNAQNRSKAILATALIALREEETRIVGAELIHAAAQASALDLSRDAAGHIWNEALKQLPEDTQLGTSSLSSIAVSLSSSKIPDLGDAHRYYLALEHLNQGKSNDALRLLSQIGPESKYYRRSKLHEGMVHAAKGDRGKAKDALEVAASLEQTLAESEADMSDEVLVAIKEKAILNLARLHFESGEFKSALSLYRSIDAQSSLFYESLSEQGWAFFMAGYPNRALGSEYGATSPHFNQLFQPDQYFLNAAVNYWLCDFDAAKNTIHKFVAHTKEDANLLRKWAARSSRKQDKNASRIYQLVEDISQGVSQKNSQLGPKSLQTLGRKQVLMNGVKEIHQLRQLRLSLLAKKWPRRSKNHFINALINLEEREKERVARIANLSIAAMQKEYERSLNQLRIINLEIMTAEKDRLMEQGRTSVGQEFLGTEKEFLELAENSTRKWNDSKQEYWKDELDKFVFNKKSQCSKPEGETKNEDE